MTVQKFPRQAIHPGPKSNFIVHFVDPNAQTIRFSRATCRTENDGQDFVLLSFIFCCCCTVEELLRRESVGISLARLIDASMLGSTYTVYLLESSTSSFWYDVVRPDS